MAWIIAVSVISVLLVYFGIRPLLPIFPWKKMHMERDEFRAFLKKNVEGVERTCDMMSERLPVDVYDDLADILENRTELHIRIITERAVLCRKYRKTMTNKMVDLAYKSQNVELRTVTEVPSPHIKIFDSKVAWKELPHGDDQFFREGFKVTDYSKISIMLNDFEDLWKRAKPIPPVCIAQKADAR